MIAFTGAGLLNFVLHSDPDSESVVLRVSFAPYDFKLSSGDPDATYTRPPSCQAFSSNVVHPSCPILPFLGNLSQIISTLDAMPLGQEFQFNLAFDSSLFQGGSDVPTMVPPVPPVPPSAELFSATEASDIFGFLDTFSSWEFDLGLSGNNGETFGGSHVPMQVEDDMMHPPQLVQAPAHVLTQASDILNAYPPSNSTPNPSIRPSSSSSSTLTDAQPSVSTRSQSRSHPYQRPEQSRASRSPSMSSTSTAQTGTAPPVSPEGSNSQGQRVGTGGKPLLTDPQKRMNHILSEQKRRNAIREGYAQLTTLLAPAGAPPGTGMPTRGRPKGSGRSNGNKDGGKDGKEGPVKAAGKSGVLLRAVEYIKWLEEGRAALRDEVMRVEAAAGLLVNA